MKSRIAFISAALMVPGSISAQTGDAAAGAAVTAVQRLQTAAELAAYGRAAKDPYAMIAAARMEMAVGPGSLDSKPVDKAGKAVAHSGDHKSHGSAMLDEAKAFARGDKTVLAAIDSTKSMGSRGATCGCKQGIYEARAGDVQRFQISFRGNELAEVLIKGGGASDLDLSIYNANGKLVATDTSSSTTAYASWRPSYTSAYTIEVSNVGRQSTVYYLATN